MLHNGVIPSPAVGNLPRCVSIIDTIVFALIQVHEDSHGIVNTAALFLRFQFSPLLYCLIVHLLIRLLERIARSHRCFKWRHGLLILCRSLRLPELILPRWDWYKLSLLWVTMFVLDDVSCALINAFVRGFHGRLLGARHELLLVEASAPVLWWVL